MKHFTPENFNSCTIGLLLGRSNALKDRILDSHLEPDGITAAQFKVLIIVQQFNVDTPAEMCRYLSLDSGSMTRMLDRLEQKDLIKRRRSDGDRRQICLALTEAGRRLADRLPLIGADSMNQLVGVLEPAELADLERILMKVLVAAGDALTLARIGQMK
jgi:DNA-binding MarR family transcriptional regulator